MNGHNLLTVATAASILALAGCVTPAPPVEVTRFHLGQPIARGEVAVEPRDPTAANSLEYRGYADAVSAELARLGFAIAPGISKSEVVAVVDVRRGTRDAMAERSPVSIGIGGGTFGSGVGVGGGVSFPIGRARSREIVMTELAIQLKRRSEGTVIWEGRARGEARATSPQADPAAMGRRLAQALFAGFPGESGRTITVK